MLIRLIYSSREKNALSDVDIEHILSASRRNNPADGISGMLCHGNGRFLQYLEGEADEVEKTYARIGADSRHIDIKLIEQKKLERRVFGDWSMGFIDMSDFWTQVTLKEIAKTERFQPEKFSAADSVRFITHLKATLSNQVVV